MASPLFILAPGRSYTSLVSAMLGQHPQAFGVMELNLNIAETVREWWTTFGFGMGVNAQGMLRTAAQIGYGEQTEEAIVSAWHWIREHMDWTTAALHRKLVDEIAPRVMVEKGPVTMLDDRALARLRDAYPDARFMHLLRHPRGTCSSIVNTDWARDMFAMSFPEQCDFTSNPPTVDPQNLWHESHVTISRFCEKLPPGQLMRIKGEVLLADPQNELRGVAAWLGLREDDAAIAEMMHPERSPFARPGPRNAAGGTDIGFLQSPELRPFVAKSESLEGPLPWRADGGGFRPELKELARSFGYT